MNYLKFYKLDVEPYRNDPDERFYYNSDGQRQARLRLMRGIYQRKGLMVLIGEPGRGKTTLSHHLLEELDAEQWAPFLVVVPHVACANGWLLPQIAAALGEKNQARDTLDTLQCIEAKLDAITASGRHPILMIDEAQLLADRVALEELRGLLNLLSGAGRRLSIVLFGPPELDAVLKLDTSLSQRVEIRVSIGALNEEQAHAYMTHRLEQAGADGSLFSSLARSAVYSYTGGIPRLINTLCDNTLFEGFLNESLEIDASLVSTAAEQLGMTPFDSSEPAADLVASRQADPAELLGEPPVIERIEPELEPEPELQAELEVEPPAVQPSPVAGVPEMPELQAVAPEADAAAESNELEIELDLDENLEAADAVEGGEEIEVDIPDEDEGDDDVEEAVDTAPSVPVSAAAVPGAADEENVDTISQLESLFEQIQTKDEVVETAAAREIDVDADADDDDDLDDLFAAIQVPD